MLHKAGFGERAPRLLASSYLRSHARNASYEQSRSPETAAGLERLREPDPRNLPKLGCGLEWCMRFGSLTALVTSYLSSCTHGNYTCPHFPPSSEVAVRETVIDELG